MCVIALFLMESSCAGEEEVAPIQVLLAVWKKLNWSFLRLCYLLSNCHFHSEKHPYHVPTLKETWPFTKINAVQSWPVGLVNTDPIPYMVHYFKKKLKVENLHFFKSNISSGLIWDKHTNIWIVSGFDDWN